MTDVNTNPDAETLADHSSHEGFRATRIGTGDPVDIHFYCPECDTRLVVEDIPKDDFRGADESS